ncbi:MAG: hypothetical protein WC924_00710 [Candidatus Gracilibacteria bacterium]
MATQAQQSKSANDPEKAKTSSKVDSPIEERKELFVEMVQKEKKDRRTELSQEMVTELKGDERGEKERLELLNSVLDQREAEEIDRQLAVLTVDPEGESPEKVEALMFFRDTFPYLLAVLALKNKIDPKSKTEEFLALAEKTTDVQELALLRAMAFLEKNSQLPCSIAYKEKLYSDVRKDSLVLYDAAKEVLDEKTGAGTWMKEKMTEYPVATVALLALGATVAYKAGRWLYSKAKGKLNPAGNPATQSPEAKGPGLFSKLTSGWSFLKKLTVSTALFSGGLFVAGRVMGMTGVEEYMRKNEIEWPYENRFLVALSHFAYGRMEEGLATLNFGPRTDEERERHKVYSEFFDVSDHSVWLTAGLNFKKLLDAEEGREHPLAAGIFASIPFINKFFVLPDQVAAEDAVKIKLEEKLAVIEKQIPDANTMTVDEVLKKAFELRLFETSDSAGWGEYSDDLQNLIKAEEKESADYATKIDDASKGKEALEQPDIDALKEAHTEVTGSLEELRLARPTYWLDMQGLAERVVPWLTFDDDTLQNADYLEAKASYKAFFERAQKDDLDAIGGDMQELEEVQEFFGELKPGEPLAPEEKVLLKKNTEAMKEIHQRIRDSLVRSKITRDKAIKDDSTEGWHGLAWDDLNEAKSLYFHAYKGVWYGLEWSVSELIDENTGLKGKVLGFTGVVLGSAVAGSIVFDVAQGAMRMNEGRLLAGSARMVILPGHSLPLFAYYHLRANPASLIEKVIKGKMHPDRATRYCEKAMKEGDVFWAEWYHFGGKQWGDRMRYLENLRGIFNNQTNLKWLDDLVEGTATFTRGDATWQDDLVDMVQREFKMPFEDFLTKMRAERGTKHIIIEAFERLPAKERIIQFFERMSRKLGRPTIPRPILEKWFAKGGAGLGYLGYYARIGMPVGVAYLSTYWVCEETYNAKDKGERVAMATAGILAAEIGWRAVRAIKFAPKHPLIMAGVALGASLGVTVAAENFFAPLLKDRGFMATASRGAYSPVFYTAGAGQLWDTIGHYWNPGGSEEKEYFSRETYLPLIGARKMAFHDGAFLAGGSYFEELDPEAAVAAWNSKVNSEIYDLRAEQEATKGSEEPVDNSKKIEELDAKIIDRDWNYRQIQKIEAQKAQIAGMGSDLFDDIMSAYGTSITKAEKTLMESLLVTDLPESWMDESFMNVEKEPRYATVLKFAEKLGEEDELLTFLERKRLIQSDTEFYKSIGHYDAIMKADEKDRLVAMLGVDPKLADEAEKAYEGLVQELGLEEPLVPHSQNLFI